MSEEEVKQENIDKELEKSEVSEDSQAKSHGEILKEQICEGKKNIHAKHQQCFGKFTHSWVRAGFQLYDAVQCIFSFFRFL